MEYIGVIHLVFTHKGEGAEQKCIPCVQGRGVDTSKYVHNSIPFCMYFVIFSYANTFHYTLLSLLTTFTTVLQNSGYNYFPVSEMFYSLFPDGISDWIF